MHTRDAAGVITKSEVYHHVILSGMYGDHTAQKKLNKWMGHSSHLGCGHCLLLGTCGPTGHGMYFQGYEEARAAGVSLSCNLFSIEKHVRSMPMKALKLHERAIAGP